MVVILVVCAVCAVIVTFVIAAGAVVIVCACVSARCEETKLETKLTKRAEVSK
jgi:hypothetical protein